TAPDHYGAFGFHLTDGTDNLHPGLFNLGGAHRPGGSHLGLKDLEVTAGHVGAYGLKHDGRRTLHGDGEHFGTDATQDLLDVAAFQFHDVHEGQHPGADLRGQVRIECFQAVQHGAFGVDVGSVDDV